MAIGNFIYDGISLREFNDGKYVLGYFSADETPKEGQRNYNQVPLFLGLEQPFVYSNYEDTLTFTMSVIKNPCIDPDGVIGVREMEELKRWLCRPAPHVFQLDSPEYSGIFWNGTFTVEEKIVGSKRAGVMLTFVSTSPYAYGEDIIFSGTTSRSDDYIIIDSASVEIGYLYPEIEITCKQTGDLAIYNSYDERQTIVNNCQTDETITFSKYLQISSTSSDHDIANDFNYNFLRIGNNFDSSENIISFSLPCEYLIKYNPVRKVIPV